MRAQPYKTVCAALVLALLGSVAMGQGIDVDKSVEARVVDIDMDAHTVTVEFEDGTASRTYPVADDAEFYTYNGHMPVPQAFGDLRPGLEVLLEFGNIEGAVTLRKVTTQERTNSD